MRSMERQHRPPVGVAAFIGREVERAKVAALVMDARVVTLTGPGGCGKTRLAMKVAGDVAPRFARGAVWVDLQGVSEPRLVPAALGGAVGVRERAGQALPEALAEQLQARHLLVVLDNCEHLVEACARLVRELSWRCPRLHVLATSRVPLVVEGEATFEVAGLPVPDAASESASTPAATESVRLFEVRAQQVSADFRIGDDNAAEVGEICRRLDGIPLAIELAAARVRVLAPSQILAGLADRFGLLTGGPRGAPARQRTLEASLAWSYQLLDDVQRLALARLSVFAASFELDAAIDVVAGEGIDRDDALDLVAGLVEQSLVQVVERRGRARYRLLETIRVYARQRLSDLDDPARVRTRHLEFHVDLARRAGAGLIAGQPEPWVARLTADLDDLRAAMDWAAESADLPSLVGIIEPVVRFWLECGLSREVHSRLQKAAEKPGAPAHERARGLNAAATLAIVEPASFHRSATQAVTAARTTAVDGALAVALAQRALAGVLSGLAPNEQVDDDVEQALRLVEECRDAATHAHVLQFTGAALLHSRSIDAGYDLFRRDVEVCEANDLTFHLPAAHGGALGWLVWSGRLEQVRRHATAAVDLSRRLHRPGWESAGLTGLAAVAVLQGERDRARDLLSESQAALGPALERTHYGMWFRRWSALSAYTSGDLEAARATATWIVHTGREGGGRADESEGEWLLGLVARSQQRDDDAREHLEASRSLSTNPRLPQALGRSLLGLAELNRDDEHVERAWEQAHDSLEILADYGDRVGAAAALDVVADLTVALGEPERALRLLASSERFHAEAGIVRFPLQADDVARACTRARAALDSSGAAASWEAGGEMSLGEAIAYARRGRGERQRPKTGWASLTPVERDVVRLVAEGRTNADIGQRLFISVNTVKKHLTHVYARLGVDGRADLVAQAARRDLSYHP